jgi:peptidoglycan-associated lipoprotein
MGKTTVAALITVALAACSTTKTENDGSAGTNTTAPTTATTTPVQQGPSEAELAALRDVEARKARTVYFGFDDADIKPEYRDLLAAHGAFLAKNPNVVVTVEGHCDERGTPEYNIGLGERRAKAVAQVLMSYGVQASQIKTVSFGEEKPSDAGHDESAWVKNRRGVLSYQG